MAKGFGKSEKDKAIESIKNAIRPAVDREDEDEFGAVLRRLINRYGFESVELAVQDLMDESHWLRIKAIENMPEDIKDFGIGEGLDSVSQVIEEAGLRLEEHFRVSEQGFYISERGLKALTSTGFQAEKALKHDFFKVRESLEGVGISRSPFIHPLHEVSEVDGEPFFNSWGVATFCINATLGWIDECNPQKSRELLEGFFRVAAPTADLDKMLHRSRYDDRVLMALAGRVSEGMNLRSQAAFQ